MIKDNPLDVMFHNPSKAIILDREYVQKWSQRFTDVHQTRT